MASGARYATLDGLRGVAAIMVVLHHSDIMRDIPSFAPNGFLAVDFFLMLSGFILARRYQFELETRLSVPEFVKLRIARLYPIAFVGVLIGCFKLVSEATLGQGTSSGDEKTVLLACTLNLLLIPYWSTRHHAELFPTNGPIWSLFAEIAINIAWAIVATIKIKPLVYVGITIVAGAAFLHWVLTVGANVGGLWTDSAGACARVTFDFILGTLISHLRWPVANRLFINPVTLSVALVVVLAMPVTGYRWEILSIYGILPVILALGVAAGTTASAPIREFLGNISYPLYAIHFPIMLIFSGARHKFAPQYSAIPFLVVAVALSIFAALLLVRFYDGPARRFVVGLLFRNFRKARAGHD